MTEVLSLSAVRTDGNTQARSELSESVIGEYAEAFERGDTFPPVDVYFDGTNHWLADGFHRVKAAAQARQETIDVVVHKGGQREALLHAAGANTAHGLRRSNADKRKAALTLLHDEEWRQWSDREIARHCGVSNRFVTNLRDELSVNGSQIGTRKVQRGKTEYTMDTGRIGASQTTQPGRVITMPTNRMRETPEARAGVQPPVTPSASAVILQHEATVPVVPLPAVSPPIALPTGEREELESIVPARQEAPVAMPPAPVLAMAWEQASGEERQEFVTQHRAILLELLNVQEKHKEPVHVLPSDVHLDTQPGLILTALHTATAPLSREELAQVPGVNRRVIGRNLTRLCDAGRIEKTADGRYTLQTVS